MKLRSSIKREVKFKYPTDEPSVTEDVTIVAEFRAVSRKFLDSFKGDLEGKNQDLAAAISTAAAEIEDDALLGQKVRELVESAANKKPEKERDMLREMLIAVHNVQTPDSAPIDPRDAVDPCTDDILVASALVKDLFDLVSGGAEKNSSAPPNGGAAQPEATSTPKSSTN